MAALAEWWDDDEPDLGCDATGCERPHHGQGLCAMHYRRWHETGVLYLVHDSNRRGGTGVGLVDPTALVDTLIAAFDGDLHEAADGVGVPRETFRHWSKGRRVPAPRLEAVASAVGLSFDEVYCG